MSAIKSQGGYPRGDPSEEGEDRLSPRQAISVWLVAAVTGWAITVGVLWLASKVF